MNKSPRGSASNAHSTGAPPSEAGSEDYELVRVASHHSGASRAGGEGLPTKRPGRACLGQSALSQVAGESAAQSFSRAGPSSQQRCNANGRHIYMPTTRALNCHAVRTAKCVDQGPPHREANGTVGPQAQRSSHKPRPGVHGSPMRLGPQETEPQCDANAAGSGDANADQKGGMQRQQPTSVARMAQVPQDQETSAKSFLVASDVGAGSTRHASHQASTKQAAEPALPLAEAESAVRVAGAGSVPKFSSKPKITKRASRPKIIKSASKPCARKVGLITRGMSNPTNHFRSEADQHRAWKVFTMKTIPIITATVL